MNSINGHLKFKFTPTHLNKNLNNQNKNLNLKNFIFILFKTFKMSKSNQTPIILKKDESQRQSKLKAAQTQPKILTKSTPKDAPISSTPPTASVVQIKKEIEPQIELQAMKSSMRFMFPHFNIDQKIFDFLDNENSDFLVVAAIGMNNSGKSTLMNMIADQKYVKVESSGNFKPFKVEHEIFNTQKSQIYEGSTIDMFITTDRIFVLDPSPICSNVQRRDMIVAESDDLKMLIMLFQICHLIVVVHEGYPDLSMLRMINLADMMVPSEVKITFLYKIFFFLIQNVLLASKIYLISNFLGKTSPTFYLRIQQTPTRR